MTHSLELPWPARGLSPNARNHWRALASTKKAARLAAAWECAKVGLAAPSDAPAVSVTFHPPNRLRRDLDNAIGSFKAAADGIAQAIGVDDSKWRVTYAFGEPITDGCVRVVLS